MKLSLDPMFFHVNTLFLFESDSSFIKIGGSLMLVGSGSADIEVFEITGSMVIPVI
jgi:hypothetical protein